MAKRPRPPASSTVPSNSTAGPIPLEADRSVAALAMAVAAVLLAQALQDANGFYSVRALHLLTMALLACGAGVLLPDQRWLRPLGESSVLFVLGLGLALQLAQLLTTAPGVYLQVQPQNAWPFPWGLAAAALLAGGCLSGRPWLGRAQFPLLLLVHFGLGVWLLHASPRPHIDVWMFQQESSRDLLQGVNPYSMSRPDIYGQGAALYGQGLSDGTRLSIGLPYPPLSLLLVLPGYIFGGDFRYALLVSVGLASACMAYARGSRIGMAVAVLYLFSPRGFFVLEQGWTEPLAVALLAVVVFCACRWQRALTVAFGLLLAVKQYLALAAVAWVLLLPRPVDWTAFRGRLLRAAAIALAVTLPFMLWDFAGFFRNVIAFQMQQPFRPNALSYLAWFALGGGPQLGSWVTFAAAALALVPALWFSARTPAGFAGAVAFVHFAFFAFAKQAFANYYTFVLGAICLAVAASKSSFLSGSGSS